MGALFLYTANAWISAIKLLILDPYFGLDSGYSGIDHVDNESCWRDRRGKENRLFIRRSVPRLVQIALENN